jgi:ribosomal-protein-alanine N-acetyltransferase
MRYGGDDAHLDLLAVAPPYRRAGVGRELLEWLEKCAVIAGIFSITLEVRAANEGAQLFYKRMGYRTLAHLPGYYQGIEAALRMSRDLSCRPLEHTQKVFGAEETFEKIFGVLPGYLDNVSIHRSDR